MACTRLRRLCLDLSSVKMSQIYVFLPKEFSGLSLLTEMSLTGCEVTGLPHNFTRLTRLQTLCLLNRQPWAQRMLENYLLGSGTAMLPTEFRSIITSEELRELIRDLGEPAAYHSLCCLPTQTCAPTTAVVDCCITLRATQMLRLQRCRAALLIVPGPQPGALVLRFDQTARASIQTVAAAALALSSRPLTRSRAAARLLKTSVSSKRSRDCCVTPFSCMRAEDRSLKPGHTCQLAANRPQQM